MVVTNLVQCGRVSVDAAPYYFARSSVGCGQDSPRVLVTSVSAASVRTAAGPMTNGVCPKKGVVGSTFLVQVSRGIRLRGQTTSRAECISGLVGHRLLHRVSRCRYGLHDDQSGMTLRRYGTFLGTPSCWVEAVVDQLTNSLTAEPPCNQLLKI